MEMAWRKILSKIVNYDDPNSFGSKLRKKRFSHIENIISDTFEEHGCVYIIDMGGTKRYWNIMPSEYLEKYNMHITIVNLSGMNEEVGDERFKMIDGDCCDLIDFEDNEFHVAHSNSVIEHVGDEDAMWKFAREASRVAKKYYIQTPNYWFPIEPHCMMPFFHWLPRKLRIAIILKTNVGNWGRCENLDDAAAAIDSARLLNKSLFYKLFNDSIRITERFFFLPKSIIAIRR